jgi:glycosyltransferase involved in cell wall biosynthesis
MVGYVLPHAMATGADIYTQNYVDAIASLGHELDLIAYSRIGDRSTPPANFHSAGEWHIETADAGLRAYLWLARAFLAGTPYVTTKFQSQKMLRALRALTARKQYDCTIIEDTRLCWLLKYHDVLPRPLIFSAQNVDCKVYAQQAADRTRNGTIKRAILARDARLLEQLETKMVLDSAQTWVLTHADSDGFATLAPTARDRIRVFDLPGRAVSAVHRQRAVDIDVGMLGGWLWDVNRRGLEWFMTQVVPLLPPSYRIHVAGNGAAAIANPYPNVKYEGFVDSSVDFLRRCRVIIVPSVSGGGIQIKTIEGICVGVPMVSTPIGLRGISDAPDYVSVAETAEDMARLIRERVESPRAPDFEAGARWAGARRAAFTAAVGRALSALQSPESRG